VSEEDEDDEDDEESELELLPLRREGWPWGSAALPGFSAGTEKRRGD